MVDSVPPPPPVDPSVTRSRSNTATSTASNSSEVTPSSLRSEPPEPEASSLQKEWGKPLSLKNPLGISVYKMAGKDGKGAWFARRSVHEGLGFSKFKRGMEREFPETLKVEGPPGAGNIRGIGGEKRVEKIGVDGLGKLEVYHLSAQFPGPTTPRDFVTLLITTDQVPGAVKRNGPRHYMIISRPCDHPQTQPQDGFIRGYYESVEYIREVPRKANRKSSSAVDLPSASLDVLSASGTERPASTGGDGDLDKAGSGRKRGTTVSFVEEAKQNDGPNKQGTEDEDEELNAVEWIMITRSNPGGSVPKFMIERGTPGTIVSDAAKFLDWACQAEHPEKDDEESITKKGQGQDSSAAQPDQQQFEQPQSNGHLAGLDGSGLEETREPTECPPAAEQPQGVAKQDTGNQPGLFNAVGGYVNNYAPQYVLDRLPNNQSAGESSQSVPEISVDADDDASSVSSDSTFASAESHPNGETAEADSSSLKSGTPSTATSTNKDPQRTPQEKELEKLNDRKRRLDEKFAKTREKESKDAASLSAKESAALQKAEEKHAKEVAKQEERYKRELEKLEQKKEKEAKKLDEKRKKQLDKDEKAKLTREKEELKAELELANKEREIFRNQVQELQRENTLLAARLGKSEEGRDLLLAVREKGSRSRSSSIRKSGES